MTALAPVDEVNLSGLDFAITCADEDGCEADADWWFVCLSCSRHVPLCEWHKREIHFLLTLTSARGTDGCRECHASVPAGAWRDLFTFVPIGSEK